MPQDDRTAPTVEWKRAYQGAGDSGGYFFEEAVIGKTTWRVCPWGKRFVLQHRPRHNGVPFREVMKAGGRFSFGPRLWKTTEAAQRAAEKLAVQS